MMWKLHVTPKEDVGKEHTVASSLSRFARVLLSSLLYAWKIVHDESSLETHFHDLKYSDDQLERESLFNNKIKLKLITVVVL